MESVKTEICASLQENFGPGSYVLELDTTDRCIKIELTLVSPDHVIYIRPDDQELNFLCHYAHKADLEADLEFDLNGDTLAWKQQNVAQLPRKVKGSFGKFATIAMWYVMQAAERIDLMKDMGGRRGDCGPVIETIREARAREYYFPIPKKAELVGCCFPDNDNNNDEKKKNGGGVTTAGTITGEKKKVAVVVVSAAAAAAVKKKKSAVLPCSSSSTFGGGGGGGSQKKKKINHHTTTTAAVAASAKCGGGSNRFDDDGDIDYNNKNRKKKMKKNVEKKIVQEAGYDIMFSDDEKT
jgi:hypothetical protein